MSQASLSKQVPRQTFQHGFFETLTPPRATPKKNRKTVRATSVPVTFPFSPYAPAQSTVKKVIKPAERIMDLFLDTLSATYPKRNCPNHVPIKVNDEILRKAGLF